MEPYIVVGDPFLEYKIAADPKYPFPGYKEKRDDSSVYMPCSFKKNSITNKREQSDIIPSTPINSPNINIFALRNEDIEVGILKDSNNDSKSCTS